MNNLFIGLIFAVVIFLIFSKSYEGQSVVDNKKSVDRSSLTEDDCDIRLFESNIDGTPMAGGSDMNGNSFGFTGSDHD